MTSWHLGSFLLDGYGLHTKSDVQDPGQSCVYIFFFFFFCCSNRRLWPAISETGEEEEETARLHMLGIHLPEMEIVGAIEFKLDKKTYRMIPLANSEDYLYNRQSLTKAKEVRR